MKPRKWCKEIKAWANGATIEYKAKRSKCWDIVYPTWNLDGEYRIKQPLEQERNRYKCALVKIIDESMDDFSVEVALDALNDRS